MRKEMNLIFLKRSATKQVVLSLQRTIHSKHIGLTEHLTQTTFCKTVNKKLFEGQH